jgi:hypothetical protein
MNKLIILLLFISVKTYAVTKSHSVLSDKKKIQVHTDHWGHNMSPTANTLPQGATSAGIYIIGYGLSDDIMLATSPWFHIFYNMNNFILKAKLHQSKETTIGLQVAYFKSKNQAVYHEDENQNSVYDYYQMEATISNLIYTKKISREYVFSANLGFHHYEDETVPFSVRRESFKDNPYQFNLSTFHELKLGDKVSFGFEVGFLGMNYLYPQILTGLSLNTKVNAWQMQLGFSATGTPKAYLSSEKVDSNRANNGYISDNKEDGKRDFSIHPEIQLQYYF